MSKLSFYTASFPCDFTKLADFFEKKSAKKNEYITISKKRAHYLELIYHINQVVTEEYYDTNNLKKTLEKLSSKEIIFRIYNRNSYNLIIINQPRSILSLRNFLSKIFNFDFFLSKENLNLNKLIEYLDNKIDYISKVEFREALYSNNIFSKHIFYTQNKNINLLESFTSLLKTNHYSIFKIELYLTQYSNIKYTISNDASFSFIGIDDDDVINYIFENFRI